MAEDLFPFSLSNSLLLFWFGSERSNAKRTFVKYSSGNIQAISCTLADIIPVANTKLRQAVAKSPEVIYRVKQQDDKKKTQTDE